VIQYFKNVDLLDTRVIVVYIDTGWAAPTWEQRVVEGETLAKSYGFETHRIKSMGFEELVRHKKAFPANGRQFCTMHLKGLPFLHWIDEEDTDNEFIICIGKRRAESKKRESTQEFIESSEYHGGRTVWHPLYKHTDDERNSLVTQTGLSILPHRSQECSPCVNANRSDFLLLDKEQVERVNSLEVEIGKPMFRPKRFNAIGIYGVMVWAKHGCKSKRDKTEDCGEPFGCGL